MAAHTRIPTGTPNPIPTLASEDSSVDAGFGVGPGDVDSRELLVLKTVTEGPKLLRPVEEAGLA